MGRSICNRFKVPEKSHFCIISIIRRQNMSNIETFRLLSHFSRVGLIGSVRYRILCKYKMSRSICNRFKVPEKSHFCIISIIRRQKGPMFQNIKVSILQSFNTSKFRKFSSFQFISGHSNSFQFIPVHQFISSSVHSRWVHMSQDLFTFKFK